MVPILGSVSLNEDHNREDISSFWRMMERLYGRRNTILEATHSLLDSADKIDALSVLRQEVACDHVELRPILTSSQKTIDSIMSCACELGPHLKNRDRLDHLNEIAQNITLRMSLTDSYLDINIPFIVMGLRQFALLANQLEVNPTRKSLKTAFGVDVGIDASRLRALLEMKESNW